MSYKVCISKSWKEGLEHNDVQLIFIRQLLGLRNQLLNFNALQN